MTRLHAELRRLYLCPPQSPSAAGATSPAGDLTRALVLDVGGPPSWPHLARVWQAVQDEWGLPAPAIAINGKDGHQLWFSLSAPVSRQHGHAWLKGLQQRWLADLDPRRVRLLTDSAANEGDLPVPRSTGPERWSTYVVPGLAPLFADDPWLDTEPNPDAQADLLARVASIDLDDFRRTRSEPAAPMAPNGLDPLAPSPDTSPAPPPDAPAPVTPLHRVNTPTDDPRTFLRQVMNDAEAPLAVRVEAARVLLAHPE